MHLPITSLCSALYIEYASLPPRRPSLHPQATVVLYFFFSSFKPPLHPPLPSTQLFFFSLNIFGIPFKPKCCWLVAADRRLIYFFLCRCPFLKHRPLSPTLSPLLLRHLSHSPLYSMHFCLYVVKYPPAPVLRGRGEAEGSPFQDTGPNSK